MASVKTPSNIIEMRTRHHPCRCRGATKFEKLSRDEYVSLIIIASLQRKCMSCTFMIHTHTTRTYAGRRHKTLVSNEQCHELARVCVCVRVNNTLLSHLSLEPCLWAGEVIVKHMERDFCEKKPASRCSFHFDDGEKTTQQIELIAKSTYTLDTWGPQLPSAAKRTTWCPSP